MTPGRIARTTQSIAPLPITHAFRNFSISFCDNSSATLCCLARSSPNGLLVSHHSAFTTESGTFRIPRNNFSWCEILYGRNLPFHLKYGISSVLEFPLSSQYSHLTSSVSFSGVDWSSRNVVDGANGYAQKEEEESFESSLKEAFPNPFSPSSNNPHTATLSPHFNRTLITAPYLFSFALSSNRVRNLVSFFFEMPYPNRVLNDACVSVNSTCFAFFAIDFSAETFNAPGVDGKNIFDNACNAVEEHSNKKHFCFVVVDVSS